jgi:hypothetical protein
MSAAFPLTAGQDGHTSERKRALNGHLADVSGRVQAKKNGGKHAWVRFRCRPRDVPAPT